MCKSVQYTSGSVNECVLVHFLRVSVHEYVLVQCISVYAVQYMSMLWYSVIRMYSKRVCIGTVSKCTVPELVLLQNISVYST